MDHVTGVVVAVVRFGLPDNVAFEVDLDEARGRDFAVEEAVEVDQEVVLLAGDASRDVVVD